MPETSPELIRMATRNQILLERLKASANAEFQPSLVQIGKDLNELLMRNGGNKVTKKSEQNEILVKSSKIQQRIYEAYNKQFISDLTDIGISQAELEAESYEQVVSDYRADIPKRKAISTAILVNPLQVENYNGNPLLEPFIRDSTDKQKQFIRTSIQRGFSQGLTNAEISRSIRGTRQNNFNDGDLATVNRWNQALVRTGIQHVSSQARAATMSANNDLVKGYKIVVTFDNRTTNLCMSIGQLDKTYQIGSGPMPPLHVNCRDTITPSLSVAFDFLDEGATRASKGASGGKQVSANLGSYDWLKTQPRSFQNAAIGPKRAALLNDGGLTAKEYAQLSLSKNFEPLTLSEMEALKPSVFENAGVEP